MPKARSKADVVCPDVGSRHNEDVVTYPDVDLHFADHACSRKDGTPY